MASFNQFDRVVQLMVGSLTGPTAINIEELRVVFDIKKTRVSNPNKAKIEVYGLSKEVRDTITAGQKVVLKAGYKDESNQAVIFAGDIIRSYTEKKPPDVVTIIEALDGRTSGLVKISVGYPPNTAASKIIEDLVKQTGNTLDGILPKNVKDKMYPNGVSFSGTFKESMDKVAKYTESEWSSQTETVSVVAARKSKDGRVSLISANTGMIDSPIRVSNVEPAVGRTPRKMKKLLGDVDVFPGWKVKNLLLPKIQPADGCTIESESVPKNTLFTVWSVIHKGDTRGDDWYTELEVSEIDIGTGMGTGKIEVKEPVPSFKLPEFNFTPEYGIAPVDNTRLQTSGYGKSRGSI